jgi:uncharacterized protein (UPF0548 family)
MSIRLTRPKPEDLSPLVTKGNADTLTYEPVGLTAFAQAPGGYRLDRRSCSLGFGDQVFAKAVEVLRQWQVQRGAGLVVVAEEPPRIGLVVAMSAPLPVMGFIDVVCRVVAITDQVDRWGFSYGTLSVHPEQGEESFTVLRGPDNTVTFDIIAVSRPRHVLARTFPPVARRLQHTATTRYLEAMQSAVR